MSHSPGPPPIIELNPTGGSRHRFAEGEPPAAPLDHPEYYRGVLGRRVAAFLIDALFIAVLWFLGSGLFIVLGILSLGLLLPLWGAWLTGLALAYSSFTLGGRRAATPGMRAMGLHMRTWYGEKPGVLQALAHVLLFYFSVTISSFLVLLVPLFNDSKRCLHDILCGTIVLNTEERAAELRRS